MAEKYYWEAWEGEAITQMYTRSNGNIVIVIETGRMIEFHDPDLKYGLCDPYPIEGEEE